MLDSNLYLGIDGGGSKTAFVIINDNNEVLYFKECGPTSLDTLPLDIIKKTLFEGVKDFNGKVKGIFAGIGGISCQKQIDDVKSILKELPLCAENTIVEAGNDVINALYGSLNGKDGIVLIAGTGSVCYGKHNNKYFRAGGYCYQEGDAGSSYYLGYLSLQYLARVLDKRANNSSFAKAIMKEINCYDYSSLASYFINANRTEIANLSKIVTKYSNNRYARKIIKNGVNEVLLMIKTVYKQLKFTEKTYFSIVGSLGNANTLYKELLLQGIGKISPNIVYIDKLSEAYIGSALKAKEVAKCY